MSRPIYVYGSSVLRTVGKEITPDYPDLHLLIREMFEMIETADGVGLAAPQIGLPIRVFAVDATPFGDEYPSAKEFKQIFINAKMLEESGDPWSFQEGCLSIPGIHENVMRPPNIRIEYYDEQFQRHEQEFTGIIARIIQHEYDHIEGKLFIDKISPMRRRLIQKKLKNMARGRYKASYPTTIIV